MTWMTWRGPARELAAVHELAPDATLRLRCGRIERSLKVEAGCLLVTREGDLDDHVLGPGDELRLSGRGLAVAWALTAARLRVSPVVKRAPARPARRVGALMAPRS